MPERLNQVSFFGNIGQIKINEKNVYMGVAINESYKRDGDDDWTENTVWVDVVAFGPAMKKISKAGLEKGDCIFVSGKLGQREYEEKRYTQIIAQKVQLISKPKGKQENYQAPVEDDQNIPLGNQEDEDEDDLPF